jgi:hypothetical protein
VAPAVVQTVPQPLQLLESVCRFLQVLPPQTVKPLRQLSVQVALALQVQEEPLAGTVPQPVQLLPLPWKQLVADNPVSHPFCPLLSQSSVVAVHTGWQRLPEQLVEVALVVEQTIPQPPQLLELVAMSTSQPLLELRSQFRVVPVQVWAVLQVEVVRVGLLQT